MEKLFYYHVVFSYPNINKGTMGVTFTGPINTFADVEDLKKHIGEKQGVNPSAVIIENWIELKGTE